MHKHREYIGNHTRLVEHLTVSGYVAKPEHLQRLDSTIASNELFGDDDANGTACPITYHAFLKDGSVLHFRCMNDLLNHPNTPLEIIEGLRLSRRGKDDRKLEVELDNSGEIIIDVCGPPHVTDGIIHTLEQQLRALDQEYPWFVKTFILGNRPRRSAIALIVGATFSLVCSLGMYVYALSVGVNISPELIPTGMTYYQRIESAIRSQNLSEKLDVLLLGNLRGFTNVTDYLYNTRTIIVACLLIILVFGAAAWITNHLKRYFPLAFFAMGHQQEMLTRIEKKREIWTVGIIIAFVVNIVAGILVTILGR